MEAAPEPRVDAPPSALRARFARVYRFLGPVVALASGLGSVFLARRGIAFAPAAVAFVVVAWTLAALFAKERIATEADDPRRPLPRRLRRFAVVFVMTGLYQNVLFFLLPIWAGSATWPSVNVAAPIVLGLLALVSCVDEIYVPLVLEHPVRRAAVSAIVLFASLVAATPVVFTRMPLRPNLAAAAAVSTVLGALAGLPRERLRRPRVVALITASALAAAALLAFLAPILPPVPVECMKSAAAAEVADREPRGAAEVFEARGRVYAWFAVSAPDRYAEKIRFVWTHEGEPLEHTFETTIVGGRKSGFRTWAYLTAPAPGRWRVALYADSGQLIGRQDFTVR